MSADQRELRVCHVIHHLEVGGAERLLVQLAEVAPAHRLQLSVISLTAARGDSYAGPLREAGAEVHELRSASRWDPRTVVRVADLVRSLRPDVIHTHMKHADIAGALASRRLGVPMVSTLHVIEDAVGLLQRAKRRAGATARIRAAALTVAVSDAQRRWYLETFGVPGPTVVTIRNGVDVAVADQVSRRKAREELGVPPDAILAVLVGVMRPGKGHRELIDAVRLLGPGTGVCVALAGDGPLRAELEARAATLEPGLVRFLGWRDDVPRLLSAADIVVHPTLFDALPTALIEAIGAGRPVIASAVGGVPEIVTDECGILVPPGDPAAVAQALQALAADPARRERLGRAGRDRYEAEFSADRWAARLAGVYRQVAV